METRKRASSPIIDGKKKCHICGLEKPISDYYGSGKRIYAYCKPCDKKKAVDRAKKIRENKRAAQKKIVKIYQERSNRCNELLRKAADFIEVVRPGAQILSEIRSHFLFDEKVFNKVMQEARSPHLSFARLEYLLTQL